MIDEGRIAEVFEWLAAAERELAAAVEAEIEAGYALADREAELLLDPTKPINGKNEAERQAQLRQHAAGQFAAQANAQGSLRGARLTHRLATLAVEALRMELRLRELGAPAGIPVQVPEPALDELPF